MNSDHIALGVIFAVGALCFLVSCYTTAVAPQTETIEISTYVENLSVERGIVVQREASFEYMFSEGKGIGGAGGQGGVLSRRQSADALVDMAQQKNATIHYTMTGIGHAVEKTYWVYAEGTYFYWKDSYSVPNMYLIASGSPSQIILEKNTAGGIFESALLGIAGSLATLCGLVLLMMFISIAISIRESMKKFGKRLGL